MSRQIIPTSLECARRPENPSFSEELVYCSQVSIGYDGLEDGSVTVFRRIGDVVGVVPCPDIGRAFTVLLLLHREIRLSAKAGDLTGYDGFHVEAVEVELDELFQHFGPHLRIIHENSIVPFDDAFDRDAHFESVADGREILPER